MLHLQSWKKTIIEAIGLAMTTKELLNKALNVLKVHAPAYGQIINDIEEELAKPEPKTLEDGRYPLYYRDNCMGDGDLYWLFANYKDGKWFNEDNKPLLEYVGDEIIKAIPLSEAPSQGYDSAKLEIDRLRNALSKIANWELPETGRFWEDDKGRPVSYEAEYGSGGVKRYIQNLASEALKE
jgi:hypothetical protein